MPFPLQLAFIGASNSSVSSQIRKTTDKDIKTPSCSFLAKTNTVVRTKHYFIFPIKLFRHNPSIYVVNNIALNPPLSVPPVLEVALPPSLPLVKRGRALKMINKSLQTKRKKRQNSPERQLQRALRKAAWPPCRHPGIAIQATYNSHQKTSHFDAQPILRSNTRKSLVFCFDTLIKNKKTGEEEPFACTCCQIKNPVTGSRSVQDLDEFKLIVNAYKELTNNYKQSARNLLKQAAEREVTTV